MGYALNPFRVAADLSHATSKAILIVAICRNRSAEGVSLLTQLLYALVFCTRYLDLFWTSPFGSFLSFWNASFKMIYIVTSLFIVFLMTRVYARTRETEKGWRLAGYSMASSLVIAPWLAALLAAMFRDDYIWRFSWVLHDFSEILEATCILPQLLLLRQTSVPTVIDSFYLFALFVYRLCYVFNWIWREMDVTDRHPERVDVLCGIVQVILYIDFAWVYYSRQRVKLRSGGVVDSDDFRRGLFMRRLFGKPAHEEDGGDDEESAPALGGDRGFNDHGNNERPAPLRNGDTADTKWGKRGISISADDDVIAHERTREAERDSDPFMDDEEDAPDARMRDPDELARGLEDDEDDSDDGVLPSGKDLAKEAGISGGEEWRG